MGSRFDSSHRFFDSSYGARNDATFGRAPSVSFFEEDERSRRETMARRLYRAPKFRASESPEPTREPSAWNMRHGAARERR